MTDPRQKQQSREPFIDASEATRRLAIKKATLYSYVSRNLVRVVPKPGNPRASLYNARDIEALVGRKQLRRPSKAVERALDFGMPVLETSITYIQGGRLFYRGVDAIELAKHASLEEAARLLWQTGQDDAVEFGFDAAKVKRWKETARSAGAVATDRALTLLPLLLADDQSHLRPRIATSQAAALVGAVASAALRAAESRRASSLLHERLAARWKKPEAKDAIRLALVLCADHELNASTFAVRVVASTGATVTASVLSGLAALSGPRHGAMSLRFGQLLGEMSSPRAARRMVLGRLERGEDLPGFDHPLYPDGDPRGAALIEAVPRDPLVAAVAKIALEVSGTRPTLDVGLVAIERAFELPRGSGLALFTIGRTVGWLAHAMEQRQSPQLIRPRARYVAPTTQ
jgi:citrate synthase